MPPRRGLGRGESRPGPGRQQRGAAGSQVTPRAAPPRPGREGAVAGGWPGSPRGAPAGVGPVPLGGPALRRSAPWCGPPGVLPAREGRPAAGLGQGYRAVPSLPFGPFSRHGAGRRCYKGPASSRPALRTEGLPRPGWLAAAKGKLAARVWRWCARAAGRLGVRPFLSPSFALHQVAAMSIASTDAIYLKPRKFSFLFWLIRNLCSVGNSSAGVGRATN